MDSFTSEELEQVKYALEYLHDADLSNYGQENVKALESAMDKLGMEYTSQMDEFDEEIESS